MGPAAPHPIPPLNDPGSMIQAAIMQPGRLQVCAIPLDSLQLLLQLLVLR